MARTSTFTRFIYVYLLFLLAGLGAIVRIVLIQVNKAVQRQHPIL